MLFHNNRIGPEIFADMNKAIENEIKRELFEIYETKIEEETVKEKWEYVHRLNAGNNWLKNIKYSRIKLNKIFQWLREKYILLIDSIG